MRRVLVLATLIASIGGVAGAQARGAEPGTSAIISQNIYRELFTGIRLTPEQSVRAQRVIALAEKETESARPPWATCQDREKVVVLQAQRDSMLLAMMTSAADSAKFAKHAEGFVMGPCPIHKG